MYGTGIGFWAKVVVDAKKVMFEGKEESLSSSALNLFHRDGTIGSKLMAGLFGPTKMKLLPSALIKNWKRKVKPKTAQYA